MSTWTCRRALAGLILILLLVIPGGGLIAAPERQINVLQMFTPPVQGTLDDEIPEQQYQFSLTEGQVYSLQLRLIDATLQAELIVANGKETVSGQPTAEWITAGPLVAPTTGTYSVTVRRVGTTSGAYVLRLMPGYPLIETWDTFDMPPAPGGLKWEPRTTDNSTIEVTDKRLKMFVHGTNTLGNIEPANGRAWTDFYVEADVEVEGSPTYFEYGFLFHLADDFSATYAATFSSFGDWALIHYTADDFRIIQDWTESPVIDTSDATPHLGLYVEGNSYTVFFNGQVVGTATDPEGALPEGTIGLVAATTDDQKDELTIYYDNLLISVPASDAAFVSVIEPESGITAMLGGTPEGTPEATPESAQGIPFGFAGSTKTPAASAPPPIPAATNTPKPPPPTLAPAPSQGIASWATDNPADIVTELQSNGVIPAGGTMGMTLPVSYGETSSAGYSYFPLGQGRSFRNFVLAFDAHLDYTGPMSGCGMHFRDTAQVGGVYSSSSALVTEDGYALLAQFDHEGNLHPASVMETSAAINAGQGAWNRVIVVANEADVQMYVNGELIASASFDVYAGNVALEMYVAADDAGNTAYTYCQLDNIWLWEF